MHKKTATALALTAVKNEVSSRMCSADLQLWTGLCRLMQQRSCGSRPSYRLQRPMYRLQWLVSNVRHLVCPSCQSSGGSTRCSVSLEDTYLQTRGLVSAHMCACLHAFELALYDPCCVPVFPRYRTSVSSLSSQRASRRHSTTAHVCSGVATSWAPSLSTSTRSASAPSPGNWRSVLPCRQESLGPQASGAVCSLWVIVCC